MVFEWGSNSLTPPSIVPTVATDAGDTPANGNVATDAGDTPANGNVATDAGDSPANGNVAGAAPEKGDSRLVLGCHQHHMADNYDDVAMEFSPLFLSSLERYLPRNLIDAPREIKHDYMLEILHSFTDEEELNRVEKYKEYRQKILSNYQPRCKELYAWNPSMFFVESFLKACNPDEKTENECLKNTRSKPALGMYAFDMLNPSFCNMLLSEVANFEKWAHERKFSIMRPTTMHDFGLVLDDIGMKGTLDKLMEMFICQFSKKFFADVGGSSLDSHHGFVVEYGMGKDVELGVHVDDSEVTLNVCLSLSEQFKGGELFFEGVRCEKHLYSETRPEEKFEYSHVPGHAIIHRGCHRRGAKATTSGHRINLLLWCRSSLFRELKKHKKGFQDYCGDCQRERAARIHQAVAARKRVLLPNEGNAAS